MQSIQSSTYYLQRSLLMELPHAFVPLQNANYNQKYSLCIGDKLLNSAFNDGDVSLCLSLTVQTEFSWSSTGGLGSQCDLKDVHQRILINSTANTRDHPSREHVQNNCCAPSQDERRSLTWPKCCCNACRPQRPPRFARGFPEERERTREAE